MSERVHHGWMGERDEKARQAATARMIDIWAKRLDGEESPMLTAALTKQHATIATLHRELGLDAPVLP